MSGFNQEISVKQVQIYQEYQIALSSSSASSAQLLAFLVSLQTQVADANQVVILEARGDNIINFGGSSVTASKTLTGNVLPAGNFSVPQGTIFSTVINSLTQSYVSAIAESGGSATTFAIVRLGKYAI